MDGGSSSSPFKVQTSEEEDEDYPDLYEWEEEYHVRYPDAPGFEVDPDWIPEFDPKDLKFCEEMLAKERAERVKLLAKKKEYEDQVAGRKRWIADAKKEIKRKEKWIVDTKAEIEEKKKSNRSDLSQLEGGLPYHLLEYNQEAIDKYTRKISEMKERYPDKFE